MDPEVSLCRFFAIAIAIADLAVFSATSVAALPAHQWQVTEMAFRAEREYADPFDFAAVGFRVEFVGPDGRRLVVPGFWDGGNTWRARFTPTAPGRWTYVTRCKDVRDSGLHDRRGSLDALPATEQSALRRHGGFLRASANGRYLAHTDGTPFFWLGDTWWNVPSGFVSYDRFQAMVDQRRIQGFSVFQAHGYTGFEPDIDLTVFDAVRYGGEAAVRLWREVDRYYGYAESRGMVGVIGFAATDALDKVSLRDLKRLWHYFLARYAAYPITFLLTQEYNAETGDKRGRIEKVLELGRFIRDNDPYRRAFSAHPWVQRRDGREVWREPWYDFVMLQAGHFVNPSCDSYLRVFRDAAGRPFIESETNYEGFVRNDFEVDAELVRRSVYTAFQCGASGFTYGAQGLYAGVTTRDKPATTANWGPVLTWEEGLALSGGAQMAHVRRLFETLEWWRLLPWSAGKASEGILVRSVGREVIVAYVPRTTRPRGELRIAGFERPTRYRFDWFDPRTGLFSGTGEPVTTDHGTLRLPPAPSLDDWLIVARIDSERELP